jgi:chemotaxis protein methyltransferase CheR
MVSTPSFDRLGRDFQFTEMDFQEIRELIYAYAGISLSNTKKAMVYSRVGRRLRINGFTRFCDYLTFLKSGDKAEWQAFVNALTTNLTSFFREKHHFPLLAEHVRSIRDGQPINLWCCAASTGEEPYTMAMTMVDVFGSYNPPVHILATDVDTQVLKTAAAGIYSIERVESLSSDVLRRFFLKGTGSNAGTVRVRQELRNMISFQPLNLHDQSWPVQGSFDAVFCRNVMIYFDKPTQRKILQKIVPFMRRDALFFAGHSESFHHAEDLFSLRGSTVYQVADEALHLSMPAR